MAALELDAHRLQKKGIQDYLARNKGTGSMLSITVKESIIARSGDADLAIIITTAKDCKFKTSLCVRVSILKDKEGWGCISTEMCLPSMHKIIDPMPRTEKMLGKKRIRRTFQEPKFL